jgi:hypothetical protein
MTKLQQILLTLAVLGTTTTAHMQMSYPPPLKSKSNPHTNDIDYSMTSPLSTDGSNFPCKGYLSLLNTPQGESVASWSAGETYNFTIVGGANHNGGSCQAALSVDRGQTFRVVRSYEGGCPGQGESSFEFSVPRDTPAIEKAVFAWTWFNNLGNREMYMNCAVVDIVGGDGGGRGTNAKFAFASRPGLFKANIGNGCRTVDSADVKFPDPGPDVESQGGGTAPSGSCGAGASSGSGGSDSGFESGNGGSESGGGSASTTTDSWNSGEDSTSLSTSSPSHQPSNPSTLSSTTRITSAATQITTASEQTSLPSASAPYYAPGLGGCQPAPYPTSLLHPTSKSHSTSAPDSTSTAYSTGAAHLPTPHVSLPVTDDPEPGYTPGNNWPVWFHSDASRISGRAHLAVLLSMLAFAYLLL